jgi:hypothetical protein
MKANTPWAPDEDAIIRDRYPHVGPEGTRIALALAGYSRGAPAVRARASALQVRKRPIGRRHANHEPATGRRPDPNYSWDYDPGFEHLFEYHPQLELAFAGRLHDDWQAHNPDEVGA